MKKEKEEEGFPMIFINGARLVAHIDVNFELDYGKLCTMVS